MEVSAFLGYLQNSIIYYNEIFFIEKNDFLFPNLLIIGEPKMRFCPICVEAYFSKNGLVCEIHQKADYIFEDGKPAEDNCQDEFGNAVTQSFQLFCLSSGLGQRLQIVACEKESGETMSYDRHRHSWSYPLENPIENEEYEQIARLICENDYDYPWLLNHFPEKLQKDIDELLNGTLTKPCR